MDDMDDMEGDNRNRFWDSIILVVTVLAMTLSAVLVTSCSPRTVYVPQEKVIMRADTIQQRVEALRTDTLRERVEVYNTKYDSVAPILDSLHRVIGYDRWHFREIKTLDERKEARMQAEIDSLRQLGREYIRDPYPVEVEKRVEVKKTLAWWQKALMWCGGILFLLLLLLAYLLFRGVRN